MDIKVGDIVEYDGHHYRVLKTLTIPSHSLQISGPFGNVTVKKSDVSLIEPVKLPTLKIGDAVVVNNVKRDEEIPTNGIWIPTASDRIGKTFIVEDLLNHQVYGRLAYFDGIWFRTYHLEKINEFDIV